MRQLTTRGWTLQAFPSFETAKQIQHARLAQIRRSDAFKQGNEKESERVVKTAVAVSGRQPNWLQYTILLFDEDCESRIEGSYSSV